MPVLLSLFPLQLVVFPRVQVPLHIFEERHKELIGEAIANHTEFGIVRVKDAGISSTGCTVEVEKVLTRYPDGRMDILTRGARRFESCRSTRRNRTCAAKSNSSTTMTTNWSAAS